MWTTWSATTPRRLSYACATGSKCWCWTLALRAIPPQSESYFLVKAMAPDENLESLQPKLREGEGLGGVTLRDYDVIAIAASFQPFAE